MSLPSGPILPKSDTLNSMECGKFVLSNLAARRAKQLKEGAPPLVRVESNHPLTIALAEIAAGKIKPILGAAEPETSLTAEGGLPIISDEPIPSELGILLPALDESEAEILSVLVSDESEHHDDEEESDGIPSLDDLLVEGDVEAESAVVSGEEDTLSLTDIAEQENLIDEDSNGDD